MKRRLFLSAAIATAGMAWLPLSVARGDSPGTPSIGDIVLTEIERRLIASYYQRRYDEWGSENHGNSKHKHKGLPPGIAKKGTLPPGIYKQLVRNDPLPPGLGAMPLPYDLAVQLPPRPSGQRLLILDDKVLLVQAATNMILDVLTVAAVEAIRNQ
jgi:hypothetical protein